MNWLCLFKLHKRSASRAWVDGAICRSICKTCGVPLVRVRSRHWVEAHRRVVMLIISG